jgi:hypothetical protein
MPPAHPRPRLTGKCLCERVQYEVDDDFRYAMYCHCSLCRRVTGSAFKALAGIEAERLALVRGGDEVQTLGESGWYNVNCRHCGSLLYAVVRDGKFVHVTMGTLADIPTIRPTMHIFVGSKAPWHEITDDLPQYEAFPPAEQT